MSGEELRAHLRGEEVHVDFERGLNLCVLQVRRALGDDARSPRYVETLPRRGYRSISEVAVLDSAALGQLEADFRAPPPLDGALGGRPSLR